MIDDVGQIEAVRRRVGSPTEERTRERGGTKVVALRQTYDTDIDDLWDACTNPERIPRWFLPIKGELRVGGRYELEGNAHGTVERCDPPHAFAATWEYGDTVSWIEVRLVPEEAGRTRLELDHIVPVDEQWRHFGPGAPGVGWDLALLGLSIHLRTREPVDRERVAAWSAAADGRRFMTSSSEAWCAAAIAGGAEPREAEAAADRTIAAYLGVESNE